jgi:hypothetical protein
VLLLAGIHLVGFSSGRVGSVRRLSAAASRGWLNGLLKYGLIISPAYCLSWALTTLSISLFRCFLCSPSAGLPLGLKGISFRIVMDLLKTEFHSIASSLRNYFNSLQEASNSACVGMLTTRGLSAAKVDWV